MEISQRLIGNGGSWNRRSAVFVLLLCVTHIQRNAGTDAAATEGEEGGSISGISKNSEDHVPQVRYRSRPVAPFRSSSSKALTSSSNTTGNSSSEEEGPGPSGVPFFAVHDLSSQTFERLQENWRNLEAFIRNLQARRSQDESQRAQTLGGGLPAPSSTGGDRDNRRRAPPYSNNNNMFTFKYHPVVLEGEGSTSVDDIIAGDNSRGISTRHYNGGNHFSPFPVDGIDHTGKHADMEKHTVATIYTIGICLTIMAIGSVMFILINKCDGTGGNSYTRAIPPSTGGRGVLAAGRAAAGGRQGRTRSSRRGAGRSANSGNDQSGNHASSDMFETDAKVLTDLPPSYDSLFPEDIASNLQEVVQTEPSASTSHANVATVKDESTSRNTQNENPPPPTAAESA